MHSHEDVEVCRRAQRGDAIAASELIDRHYARIFGYLRRLCGSDQEAADLTQSTFHRAWVSLSGYRGEGRFTAWLHQLAYRTFVDWLRRRRPTEVNSGEWWTNHTADGPSPFDSAADRDMAHCIYRAVDEMEADLRQTMHLHYYQGLSLAETAEVLGLSPSAVKHRLRTAVEQLRQRFVETSPGKP